MREFLRLAKAFRETAIVDDDFPEMRDRFDLALKHMLQDTPRIVCLCGSTRFYKEFQRANYDETGAGNIVLSVGFYMHSANDAHGEDWGCTPEMKVKLDRLHFRKIELADEVLVLNVGGYIGESTRNEINHATRLGKPIRYLESAHAVAGGSSE
jgi:hypothetical protein